MRLRLVGHDYKYAVEQIMLSVFPDEKPQYAEAPFLGSGELFTESRLRFGSVYAQATTVLHCNCKIFRGNARVSNRKLNGKLVTDRLLQKIIKQSFYRAASQYVEGPPPWGSLTGIRPSHIAATAIMSGKSAESAKKLLIREYYVSPERAHICTQTAQASLALKDSLLPKDIALYIGIPFCPTRCSYCSFVSNSVEKSFDMIASFVDVLLDEIAIAAKTTQELGLSISSVYVGGGTPTTLSEDSLEAILSKLHSSFDLSNIREFTFEAGRPDTITPMKLEIIRRYGADRICVNPQSMSDKVLSAIGRKHSAEDFIKAVQLVKKSGAKLNIDIIAGLPADTIESFKNTVEAIVSFFPENVTVHTLSLKKGSRIMLDGTQIPSGKDVEAMLSYSSARLSNSGFYPYYLYRQKYTSGGFENIGWCIPGHEGIYNISMMEELCTVLALGGGGVTKLVSAQGRIERIFNAKYPREYILFTDKLSEKYAKILNFYS